MTKNPEKYSTRSKVLAEIAPVAGTSIRNLELYVAEGAKLCLLAGAGQSLFMLQSSLSLTSFIRVYISFSSLCVLLGEKTTKSIDW